jgi:hypothetical protein
MGLRGENGYCALEVAAIRKLTLLPKIVHQRVYRQLAEVLVVFHESQRGLHRRPQRGVRQRVGSVFRRLLRHLQRPGVFLLGFSLRRGFLLRAHCSLRDVQPSQYQPVQG